mgnify:CR=1 FL=1
MFRIILIIINDFSIITQETNNSIQWTNNIYDIIINKQDIINNIFKELIIEIK